MKMKNQKGFTLIELLVTVVIVAILASVALPEYRDYVMRGKLIQATATLSDARIKMEQHAQDNPVTGYANPVVICPAATPYFVFDCNTPAATVNTYTITATGVGDVAGFIYTIDQANVRATPGAPGGWNTSPPGPASCWIIKRNSSC